MGRQETATKNILEEIARCEEILAKTQSEIKWLQERLVCQHEWLFHQESNINAETETWYVCKKCGYSTG